MICPHCKGLMRVVYTNHLKDKSISRKRMCDSCSYTMYTSEIERNEYISLKQLLHDTRYTLQRYINSRKGT